MAKSKSHGKRTRSSLGLSAKSPLAVVETERHA
jgi:hypothetical protein